ncbi:hypothetical protein ATN00_01535 [Sphingobium baderi]|uniref:Uncharacterized protein n=1 Tax=Sphingobium baderi TaxID=1332080 RepID=A0A0S3EUT4_9SPHN|nr:hypothetical protein ATN00_01535 [Sphingobium baderi]
MVLVVMALRQTEKSLAQAREANSIAKNSAIRQLRAYLGIESVIVESRSVIKLRVRNFGQTPAVNVKMITRHMIDENGEWFPVNHPFGMVDPDHCVTGVIRAGTYGPTLPTKPCKLHIKIAISYDDQMGGKWNREATFYLADWLFKKMPWELHVYPDTAKETEREE